MSHLNKRSHAWLAFFLVAAVCGCSAEKPTASYDVIVRGGTVYDGLGGAPVQADVAISGDRIAAIGDLSSAAAL